MTKRLITILIILISVQSSLVAQEVSSNLVSFSEKDGIPSNTTYSILQDHLGFIWIGTDLGLLKYDGYKFHRYELDQHHIISSLFEDSEFNLWIGTEWGVFKYNRIKQDYYLYNYYPKYNLPQNKLLITKRIEEDINGTIWLAVNDLYGSTIKDGLAYLKKGANDIEIFNSEHNSLGILRILDIETDKKNNLWVCGVGGLRKIDLTTMSVKKIEFENSSIRSFDLSLLMDDNGILWGCQRNVGFGSYDPSNGNVKAYTFNTTNNSSLSNNYVRSIIQDKDGTLWLGTHNGINHFNVETEKFKRYFYHHGFDINVKDIGIIQTILMDKSGSLWLGSFDRFVHKFDLSKNLFRNYNYYPSDQSNPRQSWIFALFEDTEGNIWIGGTISGGLSKYNPRTSTFTQIPNYNIPNRGIRTIYQDREQTIWIGCYPTGLLTFNPADSSFNNIVVNFPGKDSNPGVIDIFEDHLLNFWIGTDNGLFLFDRLNRKMERIIVKEIKDYSLGTERIQHIFESRKKELWIGTRIGLYKYNHNRKTFKRYLHDPNDSNSLSSSNIRSIYEDKDGILWLGTLGGLNRFNPESDTFTHFTKKDGLPSNRVEGILEDEGKNTLWLSTYEGISSFDLTTKEFRNFDASHGLAGKQFTRAALETRNGEFIFGGKNGVSIFHPDAVLSNLKPPDLIISDFKIFNTSVPVGDNSPLQKPIYQTKEIVLASDENDISFDFLATHYVDPSHNEYAYMLENYENEWRYVGNINSAIYPNLPPGEYIFCVKAANNIGVWNEEGVSIKLIILPPWWATSWAYIVYVIIFFNLIYFTWKIQLKKIRIKNDYKMSKFEAEKMHEVDEIKSRFFANLSHEFRTPLTLIFGPAKDIMENSDDKKAKQNAGIIKRNTSRLYKLVNQLLDLSKLEAGKMKLKTREQNIIPFLKGVVLSFNSLAERKKITLRFNIFEETLRIYIDKDKVEKIINNLLFNAFQFTPEGGEIDFTVKKLVEEIEIKISDNGIGIPKEKINKIFDRFYQVDGSHTREGEGTGIGLALTKELVELHKGKITVQSKEGEGATFTILLPLGKAQFKSEEIVDKDEAEEITETIEKVEFISEPAKRKGKTDIDVLIDIDKPLLLLVEDNSDVRKYIINHLEEDYRIQEAVDGEDGLSQASNHIPDLIISDVMMPKMDGFELCNKLKSDERTSHIPVIMLTAKATSQDKIEGYETGADDYIMKPFDAAELKVRIKNLIELRRKLQKKFSSDDFIIPKELSSIDESFLKKVLNAINDHISEEKFSIEDLGKEAAMSRKHLHRKLKALTNKSPSQFIRSIRLSKARKLIKEKKGTISEISFMVGFSTPIYFNKCFKEEFGYSPGEVIG